MGRNRSEIIPSLVMSAVVATISVIVTIWIFVEARFYAIILELIGIAVAVFFIKRVFSEISALKRLGKTRNKEDIIEDLKENGINADVTENEWDLYKYDKEIWLQNARLRGVINYKYAPDEIKNDLECVYEASIRCKANTKGARDRFPKFLKEEVPFAIKQNKNYLLKMIEFYNSRFKGKIDKIPSNAFVFIVKSGKEYQFNWDKYNSDQYNEYLEYGGELTGDQYDQYVAECNLDYECLCIVEILKKLVKMLPEEYQNEKTYMELLQLGKDIGFDLSIAPEPLQNDKNFILKAIEINRASAEYIPQNLQKDKEFMLAAIKCGGAGVCEYASNTLKKNQSFMLEAIKLAGFTVCEYSSEKLMSDRNFVTEAISISVDCFYYASNELREDAELARLVIENGGSKQVFFDNEKIKIVTKVYNDDNSEKIACRIAIKYDTIDKPSNNVFYNELLNLSVSKGSLEGARALFLAVKMIRNGVIFSAADKDENIIGKMSVHKEIDLTEFELTGYMDDETQRFVAQCEGYNAYLDVIKYYKSVFIDMVKVNAGCFKYLIPEVKNDQEFWDKALKANPGIQEQYMKKWGI